MDDTEVWLMGFRSDVAAPARDLAAAFSIDEAVASRLVQQCPVRLKRGLDDGTARKYQAVLLRIGALVEVRTNGLVRVTMPPSIPISSQPPGPVSMPAPPVAAEGGGFGAPWMDHATSTPYGGFSAPPPARPSGRPSSPSPRQSSPDISRAPSGAPLLRHNSMRAPYDIAAEPLRWGEITGPVLALAAWIAFLVLRIVVLKDSVFMGNPGWLSVIADAFGFFGVLRALVRLVEKLRRKIFSSPFRTVLFGALLAASCAAAYVIARHVNGADLVWNWPG